MTDSETFGDTVYEHGEGIADAGNRDPVENLTSDDPDEIMQTGYVPPDREPYDSRHAPTAAEQRDGPNISERLAAEEPGVEPAADDLPDPRAERLVAPDEDALEGRRRS